MKQRRLPNNYWFADALNSYEANEPGCTYWPLGEIDGHIYALVVTADKRGEARAKIAYNCDDLRCDSDWDWMEPANNAGKVIDSEISVCLPITPTKAAVCASYLLETWSDIKRLARDQHQL